MNTPAPGQETAQAVLDIIRLNPELHDQKEWRGEKECGTTHCVGGWAQALHWNQWSSRFVAERGRQALELDKADAYRLFYSTDNPEALHALEYLAKGEQIDWEAVFGKDPEDNEDTNTHECIQMWESITS